MFLPNGVRFVIFPVSQKRSIVVELLAFIPISFLLILLAISGIFVSCKEKRTDHFDGRRFYNTENLNSRSKSDIIKWFMGRKRGKWPKWIETEYGPDPVKKVAKGKLVVTFINHASILCQFDNHNILFDPVWSKRVSPVKFAGPKRVRNPGIKLSQLPEIHVVMVSHDHYDHMDKSTLLYLKNKFNPLFIVPLKSARRLKSWGIKSVVELDWWQNITTKAGLKVTFVPARHSSGRSPFDQETTLWGGFIVKTSRGELFFAGDTGYGKHFKKIGRKFKNIRFSMLPIGAYKPRWFMKSVHMDPKDALKAHEDLKSKTSMAMHYGTFPLADDSMVDPLIDLRKLMEKYEIPDDRFLILKEGTPRSIP
jgi:L-ascorbate metabolism protein UlaG (beta-lactamase superfamily)